MKNKVSPLQGIQLTSQQRYSPVSFTIAGNLAYKLAKIFTCASASCLILSYLWARCLASSKGAPITIARSGSATQNSRIPIKNCNSVCQKSIYHVYISANIKKNRATMLEIQHKLLETKYQQIFTKVQRFLNSYHVPYFQQTSTSTASPPFH